MTLDTWDDSIREELCHGMMAHGWGRQFPGLGALFMMSVAIKGEPSTLENLTREFRSSNNPTGDWDGPCWDEYEPLTAERLAELNEMFGDELRDDRDVDVVNAESLADHAALIAQVDRYAAHFDLGPVRTARQLLELIIRTGVVNRSDDGLLRPAYPLPPVEDLLPVTDEERALLIRMREEDAREQAERAAAPE